MTTKYDAKKPLEIEGRDKPIWMNIGISVTVRDDGKVSIFDNRLGVSFPCFERKPRDADRQADTSGAGSNQGQAPAQADGFDDIPF